MQSTPESGHRAGYGGRKPKKGSRLLLVVDTLGYLLIVRASQAHERDQAQVQPLDTATQGATGEHFTPAHVDQIYTGDIAEEAAAAVGIELHAVKLSDAKHGFVLFPHRWSPSARLINPVLATGQGTTSGPQ